MQRDSTQDRRSLNDRIEAVESFIDVMARVNQVGDLRWKDVERDYRKLVVNATFRRQIETLRAAAVLAREGVGHLAVSFVRASLEDVLYISFFSTLPRKDSQVLFLMFGNWDSIRSLLAQRAFVGDDEMVRLWYSTDFLQDVERKRDEVAANLKVIQKKYKWAGGTLPSASWIAERAGKKQEYDYLHAATSRAVHFSAGEIMRRGWGHPSGIITTEKPEFREHLANFALDQLWRLYVQTWEAASSIALDSGIVPRGDVSDNEMRSVVERLLTLGKVPLVHAREWNLTSEGPLDLS